MKLQKYISAKTVAIVVVASIGISIPIAFYIADKINSNSIYKDFDTQLSCTEKVDLEKLNKGTINVTGETDEETSTYTVSDGFESNEKKLDNNNLVSKPSGNKNLGNTNQGNVGNNQSYVNKSYIRGNDIVLLQDYEFNPYLDLNLQAMDKDGKIITEKIVITKNNVDTSKPGKYSVNASVKLKDGSTLEKSFNVMINKAPLRYSLYGLNPREEFVAKNGVVNLDFNIAFSEQNIYPKSAIVNGKEYNVEKQKKSIFRIFGNKELYSIELNAGSKVGYEVFNIEKLKMSDGSILDFNKQTEVCVLKDDPIINNLSYEEKGEDGDFIFRFNMKDIDNALSNMKAVLYTDKGIFLEEVALGKKDAYSLDFNVDKNGKYIVQIYGDVNTKPGAEGVQINKLLASKDIEIFNIDKSSISGDNIEIYEGDTVDIQSLLNITATDIDGSDISNQVILDELNLDVYTSGNYEVKIYVTNSKGVVLEKVLKVTVKPKTKLSYTATNASDVVEVKEHNDTSRQLASSSRSTVIGNDTNPLTGDVTLEGNIMSHQGTAPSGRIHVELPTSMYFAVDQDGNFTTATSYSITNKSGVDIEVSVGGFTETKPSDGILVKKDSIDANDSRATINLDLVGNVGTARLYNDNSIDTKISEVKANSVSNITLVGKAGKAKDATVDNNGVSEDFNIRFIINKK